MSNNYALKLGDSDGRPIRFNGQTLHLGHLVGVMVMAASEPSKKHFDELVDICDSMFDPVDRSRIRLMQQLDENDPLGSIPDYDRAHYGRFTGSGSMGSANVQGLMELLFREDTWVQFGVQLRIHKVLGMFGGSKSLGRIIEDLSAGSMQVNSSPDAVESTTLNGLTIKYTSNEVMHNYMAVTDDDPPLVTWRIGNRAEWGHFAP